MRNIGALIIRIGLIMNSIGHYLSPYTDYTELRLLAKIIFQLFLRDYRNQRLKPISNLGTPKYIYYTQGSSRKPGSRSAALGKRGAWTEDPATVSGFRV